MLHTLTAIERMSIRATDGDIGRVHDTYFDDQAWTLRYLVVDTGKWLPGRKVLISPMSVAAIDWPGRSVELSLTREQIENSPTFDSDKPVSRQHETAYFDYYGYPYYWAGPLRWGPVPFPGGAGTLARVPAGGWADQQVRANRDRGDPHLRSTDEVTGYRIEAADGEIGHAQDFLYDERNWALRFLAVDTRNWWPGRHVLVAIEWVERVSWDERRVHLNLPREAVREAPEWRPELALAQQDEELLHRHASQGEVRQRGIGEP